MKVALVLFVAVIAAVYGQYLYCPKNQKEMEACPDYPYLYCVQNPENGEHRYICRYCEGKDAVCFQNQTAKKISDCVRLNVPNNCPPAKPR